MVRLPLIYPEVDSKRQTFAQRLGRTAHLSLLRRKLQQLWRADNGNTKFLEEWLVDVANARGARIIFREGQRANFEAPGFDQLTDEELVVGLILLQNIDSPQMIRLAAQLISRDNLDLKVLALLAVQERAGFVMAALAREALKVDQGHALWRGIRDFFEREDCRDSPILHYTRLAEPVMQAGKYNAEKWQLVR